MSCNSWSALKKLLNYKLGDKIVGEGCLVIIVSFETILGMSVAPDFGRNSFVHSKWHQCYTIINLDGIKILAKQTNFEALIPHNIYAT